MAAGPLLISEPLQRYRALGLAGDPVWRAAGQLRAAIAQRLSRKHADLLAVPEVDPTGRRIDWYAPFEGQVRKLSELDDSERQAILRCLVGSEMCIRDRVKCGARAGRTPWFARVEDLRWLLVPFSSVNRCSATAVSYTHLTLPTNSRV